VCPNRVVGRSYSREVSQDPRGLRKKRIEFTRAILVRGNGGNPLPMELATTGVAGIRRKDRGRKAPREGDQRPILAARENQKRQKRYLVGCEKGKLYV